VGDWHDFFLGELGASAALAGLLFVAISINLSKILDGAGLAARAAEALIILGAILVVSSLALMPQPAAAIGLEAAAAGAVLWLTIVRIHLHALRAPDARYSTRTFSIRVVMGQCATLPLLAGGILLALGSGSGPYVLGAGAVLAIVVALLTCWVLLVEINR
jgi:modulator of FtsH protease